MKKLLILLFLLSMVGCCANNPPKVQIVVEKVPVPYVPAPPQIVRTVITLNQLTVEQKKDIGLVSQAIKIDRVTTEQYINKLETIIDKYRELSKNNPVSIDKEKSVESVDWKPVQAVEDYFKETTKD